MTFPVVDRARYGCTSQEQQHGIIFCYTREL